MEKENSIILFHQKRYGGMGMKSKNFGILPLWVSLKS